MHRKDVIPTTITSASLPAKKRILTVCVKLFLEQGYKKTTVSEIVHKASVSNSIFQNIFRAKDGVLTELVEFMFSNQFAMARTTAGAQLPPVYVYAVETAIQMTLTELNENLREIYIEAYTQKEASDYIFQETAKELYQIFGSYQPELTARDFYAMEIGSAGIMRSYLEYVSTSPSRQLLVFSLIFSVWFPMRATSCLMHSVRKAYGVSRPASMIGGTLRNFFFTLWLIVTIAASIVLTTVGHRALAFAAKFVRLPDSFIDLWGSLRFVLLGVVMLLVLVPLNMVAQGRRCPLWEVVPGVLLSMAAWLALSLAFSYYVEQVAHYSELYGSIATIVVVLLWLYMTGQVLIMGAEYNGARLAYRSAKSVPLPKEEEQTE